MIENDTYSSPFFEPKTTIRVATYNVGHWNYGLNPSGYFGDDIDKKKSDSISIFNDLNADIISINEYSQFFDRDETIDSKKTFFDPLYDYSKPVYDAGLNSSIFSKFEIVSSSIFYLAAGNRQCSYASVFINGSILNVYSVHLALSESERAENIYELLSMIDSQDNVIICGDWNVTNVEEYSLLKNSDLQLVNGDFLPYSNTYGYSGGKPLDNIVVSKTFEIISADIKDVFEIGVSDHLPLVCEIALNRPYE